MKTCLHILFVGLLFFGTAHGSGNCLSVSYVGEWPCSGTPVSVSVSPVPTSSTPIAVACRDASRIIRYTTTGIPVCQWNSFSGQGYPYQSLNAPEGVVVDGSDCAYMVDSGSNRVIRFFSCGELFNAPWAVYSGTLNNPGMIAKGLNGFGMLYVSDRGNNRIVKLHGELYQLRTWGDLGSGHGQFNNPGGIAVDHNEDVYVVDSGNGRIQKFDSTGVYLASWGGAGSGPGQFANPTGIAVDALCRIYVADTDNNRIQIFDCDGKSLGAFGELGTGPGQMNHPRGVAVDSDLNVYVADTNNQRIQVFRSCPVAIQRQDWTGVKQLYR